MTQLVNNQGSQRHYFTSEDDAVIREHVNTYGPKIWNIAAVKIGCSEKLARARFKSVVSTIEQRVKYKITTTFTPEQDQAMKQHVTKHGTNDWKEFAASIDKTVNSCRKRFWKHFATPTQVENRQRGRFNAEKDTALRVHFNTHGAKDWRLVAEKIGRNVTSCSNRFWTYLATPQEKAIRTTSTFSPADDAALRAHFEAHGAKDWRLVAEKINRIPTCCGNRFWTYLATPQEKANRTTSTFSPADDATLRAHFEAHGSKDWRLVSEKINRIPSSCSSHFWAHLATPEEIANRTTRYTFNAEKNAALRAHFNTHGAKDWRLVAEKIGSNVFSCSSHFWTYLATPEEIANRTTSTFSPADDAALRAHFEVHGSKDWRLVAEKINKNVDSCSKRFWAHLATPQEKANRSTRSHFSLADNAALRDHFNTHGAKDWGLVAKKIGRTPDSCSSHFWVVLATHEEKENRTTRYTLTPRVFKPADNAALRVHFNTHGAKDWRLVAKKIGRTPDSCSSHFWAVLATHEEKENRATRSLFSPEDDAALRAHVKNHGPKNWELVAEKLNKIPNSCYGRYRKVLATPEENSALACARELLNLHGKKQNRSSNKRKRAPLPASSPSYIVSDRNVRQRRRY